MREIAKFPTMAALLAVAGNSLVLAAQQMPQETFRSGVEIVRLDVSVLDKNRRPVRHLTAADFTVLEEGDAQPIVAFSAVDVPETVTHTARWMRDVGSDVETNRLDTRRIVAIVMDDANTDIADAVWARTVVREVIDRLGPNDLAGVVFTFTGRPQNFTSDHRLLQRAVETFVPKNSPPPRATSAAAGNTPRLGSRPIACQARNCLLGTLKDVARALQDTPEGRKTIVLVSPGVPISFAVERLEGTEDGGEAKAAFEALRRANINVYSFDPSGVTQDGIAVPRLDALRTFAEHTGGRATFATNAPEAHVAQVFVENSSYYLIGIRASRADRGDSFRKLTVKVNRPDLDVRTRAGYYVERPRNPLRSTAAEQPQTALDKLFGKALPTGDLPLAVSVAPFARPGTREAVLAVTIGTVRPSSEQVVTEQVRLRTTAYEYEVYRDRGTVNQTVELTARPSAAGERRFDVPARLSVPPGRYEVRVGAESSSGAAGAVFVNTDVPNFAKAKLALSGLVLGHRRRASTGPSDVLADVIPVEPTVRREFVTAEPVQAFVRVYQGGAAAPLAATVAARIIDSTDREVFGETVVLAREQFGIARAADYQLNLGRTTLGPGAYLLSIEVKAANNTVRRELRFTVTSATGATTPGPV